VSTSLLVDVRHQAGTLTLRAQFELATPRTALFGPSGAGKSTLLRVLAGLTTPASGRVVLDGRVLVDTQATISLPPGARGIGFLMQSPALFPHLTVERNLRFGLRSLPLHEQNSRVRELGSLLALEPLLHRLPERLSGGERQRVALARALATQPRLLLLDEPFSALDGAAKTQLWAVLEPWLARHGTQSLLVSHDAAEVWAWAERVVRIVDGVAIQQGTPQEMLLRERELALQQFSRGL